MKHTIPNFETSKHSNGKVAPQIPPYHLNNSSSAVSGVYPSSHTSSSLPSQHPPEDLDRLLAFYQDEPDFSEVVGTERFLPIEPFVQHTRKRGKQPNIAVRKDENVIEAEKITTTTTTDTSQFTTDKPKKALGINSTPAASDDDDYNFHPADTDEIFPFDHNSNQLGRSLSRGTATSDLHTTSSVRSGCQYVQYSNTDPLNTSTRSMPNGTSFTNVSPHHVFQSLGGEEGTHFQVVYNSAPGTPIPLFMAPAPPMATTQLFLSPSMQTPAPMQSYPQTPLHLTPLLGLYPSEGTPNSMYSHVATHNSATTYVTLPRQYNNYSRSASSESQQSASRYRSQSVSSAATSSRDAISLNSAAAVANNYSSARSASATSLHSYASHSISRPNQHHHHHSTSANAAAAAFVNQLQTDFEKTDRFVAEIYQYQEAQEGALLFYNEQRSRLLELQGERRDPSAQPSHTMDAKCGMTKNSQLQKHRDPSPHSYPSSYQANHSFNSVEALCNNSATSDPTTHHHESRSQEGSYKLGAASHMPYSNYYNDDSLLSASAAQTTKFSFIDAQTFLPADITTDPSAKKKPSITTAGVSSINDQHSNDNDNGRNLAAHPTTVIGPQRFDSGMNSLHNAPQVPETSLSRLPRRASTTSFTQQQQPLPPAYIDWPAIPIGEVLNGHQPQQLATNYKGTLGAKAKKKKKDSDVDKQGNINSAQDRSAQHNETAPHRRVSRFMPPPPPSLQAARVMAVCHPTKGGGAEYYEGPREAAIAALVAAQAELHGADGKTCIAEGDFAFLTKAGGTSDWARGGYGATYSATLAEGAPAAMYRRLDPSGDGFQNYLQVLMQWYSRVARLFGHNPTSNEFLPTPEDTRSYKVAVKTNLQTVCETRPHLHPTTRHPPRYFSHKAVPPCPRPDEFFNVVAQPEVEDFSLEYIHIDDIDQFVAWHDAIHGWWERHVQPRTVGHQLHLQLMGATEETNAENGSKKVNNNFAQRGGRGGGGRGRGGRSQGNFIASNNRHQGHTGSAATPHNMSAHMAGLQAFASPQFSYAYAPPPGYNGMPSAGGVNPYAYPTTASAPGVPPYAATPYAFVGGNIFSPAAPFGHPSAYGYGLQPQASADNPTANVRSAPPYLSPVANYRAAKSSQ